MRVFKDLNAEKARIFRITHLSNLRWILKNGLHSANSGQADPNFVAIGNPDLIGKRAHHSLQSPGEGVLGDYVPFYFTPFSPMLLNITTGWGGITKCVNEDVIILASSIWKLQEHDVPFVFSDRHAYLAAAEFFDDPARLDRIDWDILQRRDFKRDANDPGKFERYDAEALAKDHVPVEALLGVACFNESARARIEADMQATGVAIKVIVKPDWYF
ncbi:DUF4433 domain-containing protein [Brevundimonas sp.]|jgi:hypothetical protein|uniref:type II toxin-antitoxin system toxin DNA ADP-ribosyl transferase DarT n=1 Tax=Brevundimonas sp. TaxID=1871086 RepID=UPI0028A5E124|nr:DUF4433 domain-containing protein [Brevundimonas sp.]